jgi:hypothetical protein
MSNEHTDVTISEPKFCDFCRELGNEVQAAVDGLTTSGHWADMCDMHFADHGVGLGLGRGQRLHIKS